MNFFRIALLVMFFEITAQFTGMSQTTDRLDMPTDDISTKLPPLNVLIDSAMANNPALRFNNLQVVVNKGNLTAYRAQWTQNLGVQANYGYGTFDYIYNNTLGGTTPSTYTYKQTMNQYGVGAFLRIPFYDIVNHHNQVKIAKAEIGQAQSMVETQQVAIREQVIKQYHDVIAQHRVLQIKSKYLETSRINMQMAEKGFTNGTISVDDYARVSEIASRTEAEYETLKMDFLTSYMILEEMTGMKFNIYNEKTN